MQGCQGSLQVWHWQRRLLWSVILETDAFLTYLQFSLNNVFFSCAVFSFCSNSSIRTRITSYPRHMYSVLVWRRRRQTGDGKIYIHHPQTKPKQCVRVNSLTCEHRRSASCGSRPGHRPLRWIRDCPVGTIWIWHSCFDNYLIIPHWEIKAWQFVIINMDYKSLADELVPSGTRINLKRDGLAQFGRFFIVLRASQPQ